MRDVERSERHARAYDPRVLNDLDAARAAWYESPEELRRAMRAGRRRAALLQWVRLHMASDLTARERVCVELYYFGGLTFAEAGQRTDTNASSVFRAVRRAVRRLRAAAQADDSWRRHWDAPRRQEKA